MPSPRYIPAEPRQENPLGNLLGSFLQKTNENNAYQAESDALRDIYQQYQQDGENIQNKLQAIQSDPRIGPTARVKTVDQLLKFQEHNTKLQKDAARQLQVNQKVKDAETKQLLEQQKKDQEEEKARNALNESGATKEQVALYEVSPVGGQTKIVEDIIDQNNRNKSPPGLTSPDIEDFDKGLTPKERVKRQDARFSLQTPLINKNNESLRSLQNEELSLGLLTSLEETGKLGQGLHKLNINPKTGDLFVPQFANAEEQLFVKTVNDFTVKAKDSFGANVTNFELTRFMQRLPTLANSPEGRKLILRHMRIVNEALQLEKKALQDVFDTYGVRNIDFVEAENMARKKIQPETDRLRKEALQVEKLSRDIDEEQNKSIRSNVTPGYTAMRKPDGTIKQFPTKNVGNLEEKGYKVL